MSTFKKTKVVLLTTNEKASLKLGQNGLLVNNTLGYDAHFTNQHLYFLSDEEIKEGDWYLTFQNDKLIGGPRKCEDSSYSFIYCKKIIVTTDSNLTIKTLLFVQGENKEIDVLLPQPSQSFIEKFVEEHNKGNVITEVLVEYKECCGRCIDGVDECIGDRLKINSKDNSITIRKAKDSWSREEVIELLQNCWSDSAFNLAKQTKKEEFITFDKWIEENL